MSNSRRSLWIWPAAGGVLGLLLLIAVLVLTGMARTLAPSETSSLPVLTVVARPTDTPIAPTPASATETPTPTVEVRPPPGEGGPFGEGDLVEVYGTEGEGLRLREAAGTAAAIKALAMDNEVFLVREGPVDADGRSWYRLASPSDPDRSGWAVGDFLRATQPR